MGRRTDDRKLISAEEDQESGQSTVGVVNV